MQVTTKVYGYRKIEHRTKRVLSLEYLDLPADEFASYAFWSDVSEPIRQYIEDSGHDPVGALHAAAHAVSVILFLVVGHCYSLFLTHQR